MRRLEDEQSLGYFSGYSVMLEATCHISGLKRTRNSPRIPQRSRLESGGRTRETRPPRTASLRGITSTLAELSPRRIVLVEFFRKLFEGAVFHLFCNALP
jgi:hypothetical protein